MCKFRFFFRNCSNQDKASFILSKALGVRQGIFTNEKSRERLKK